MTNVAEKFFKLIEQSNKKFKGTPLGYVFSRATIKISYGTTRNMKAHVAAHNKRVLNMRTQSAESESCNCRKDTTKCPLDGQCLIKSVVYKATVTTNQPHLKEKSYHGMTEGQFKHRWYGHKHDIAHKEKYGTTLSRHIWKLKDIESGLNENRRKNFKWNLNWEIKEQASSYQPGNKDCKLCIA